MGVQTGGEIGCVCPFAVQGSLEKYLSLRASSPSFSHPDFVRYSLTSIAMYLSYLKFISWIIALKCVFGAAEPPVPQRHPASQPRGGLGHVNAAYFVNW